MAFGSYVPCLLSFLYHLYFFRLCGSRKAVQYHFGIPYLHALLLGAFVVVFYTFLGGFSAVALTDFIQGTMMFFTVLYVPVAATIALGGPMPTLDILSKEGSDFFSFFPDSTGISALLVMIVSSLGWGLGYFGQPHILVKFMAIGDPKELKKSTRIAMTWVLLSLSFAIAIGVVGKAYLSTPLENANAERVFILMAESLSALSLQALSGLPFWQLS